MYCRLIISCCCLMVCFSAFGQSSIIKKGDVYMKLGEYEKAAACYKTAADKYTNDVTAKEKLGKALMEQGDYQSAEAVYQLLASSPMASDINKFNYAQVLRINGKYDVAGMVYRSYFELHPGHPLASEFNNFSARVQPLLQDAARYRVTNIPENTAGSDEGPTFCFYDLCYTSNGHSAGGRKGTYDLYLLRGGKSTNPANPQKIKGNINSRLNEGPATFSANGMEMIFTRSNYGHKSADGGINNGLYHAEYDTVSKKWINIQKLAFSDYNYNFMQPSLSKDGKTLFFVSDMPGGLGETDIYSCSKQGNAWSAPHNLGSSINTIGKEQTPFIADDGTLYFASDSRMGLGGLDMYSATLMDTTWGHIINPGVPLNSSRNDFGYVSDSTAHSGYLVSNRPGGVGGNDIYHFLSTATTVCGILVDAKTNKFVGEATVTIVKDDATQYDMTASKGGDFCLDLLPGKGVQYEVNKTGYTRYNGSLNADSGKQVIMLQPKGSIELAVNIKQQGNVTVKNATAVLFNPATGESIEHASDSDGFVKFDAEPNQEYVLKVSKTDLEAGGYEKFASPISTIGLKSGQVIREDAQMIYHKDMHSAAGTTQASAKNNRNNVSSNQQGAEPAGVPVQLPVVYFGVSSYQLSDADKKKLDRIARIMAERPELQLEISSNTDASGNLKSNMVLSAKRALACLDYLSEKGISKKRFIAVGYGDKKLVNNCGHVSDCTKEELARNRRTEFKIINE